MEEQDLTVSPQSALCSFALSEAEDSMECNLHCTHAYWEDSMWQMVAAEDQPALVEIMLEEKQELGKIIEEEKAQWA